MGAVAPEDPIREFAWRYQDGLPLQFGDTDVAELALIRGRKGHGFARIGVAMAIGAFQLE